MKKYVGRIHTKEDTEKLGYPIYFMGGVGGRERETINVSSSGVLMLYDVLHRVCSR